MSLNKTGLYVADSLIKYKTHICLGKLHFRHNFLEIQLHTYIVHIYYILYVYIAYVHVIFMYFLCVHIPWK